MRVRKNSSGFTIIEILVVLVIIGILLTLVISTYSGVQAKNRNNDRQSGINLLQGQLEVYYAQYSKYPTLAEMNSANWRANNMKTLPNSGIQDPQWSVKVTNCTSGGVAVLSASPTASCYSYQPVGPDGSACDNEKVVCGQYTITAMLEGGGKYVKSSLN
ncbi:MAG TPA: prepilin-type N-terminal cleavage/methylation domain-containing protein [Candidatus Saccharimonadales bacterium]|nr:prepilin-type N-terminal cleavage/methylation domain-containing protein [Candidatus Saccharimonadales bacterium]